MEITVTHNLSNRIHSTYELETAQSERFTNKLGLSEAKNSVINIPLTILNGLANYLRDRDYHNNDFDSDRQLDEYHSDSEINDLLRYLFTVEREPSNYSVSVSFTVEADDENDAEDQIYSELSTTGLDYNILSVEED